MQSFRQFRNSLKISFRLAHIRHTQLRSTFIQSTLSLSLCSSGSEKKLSRSIWPAGLKSGPCFRACLGPGTSQALQIMSTNVC
jgi:hypothetical protein